MSGHSTYIRARGQKQKQMDATIWVAIVTAIAAVIVAVINAYGKGKARREDLAEQAKAIEKHFEDTMKQLEEDKLEYLRRAAEQVEKLDEIIRGNEELKEGTMQLLGSEIDRVYFKYKGKDSIPLSEYQNIKQVFEIYDKLGGNGERRKHWFQIDHLPVVDDEE